ncbi:ATP-binding protein [Desulfoplanes sp.]
MIDRPAYLEKLAAFRDKDVIKIVSGIRRCGKSTLFELYRNFLIDDGVPKNAVISINLENADSRDMWDDPMKLHDFIAARLVPGQKNYVFLDEIQQVQSFERACDSLYIRKNVDLYITGSNAYLLSGELATLLSGRYVEIKMLPLSFKEYCSAAGGETDLARKYRTYLQNSSFPYCVYLDSQEQIDAYLDGVYSSIILKDIVSRITIGNTSSLEAVIRYMFDTIGNISSVRKIAGALTSSGRKISNHTVDTYLAALCASYVLYRADRYDVKGKKYLTTGSKYYLADIGLRYHLLGQKHADLGHILENIVYLELLRRGYNVYVGTTGTLEVDFVAMKGGTTEYYQVSFSVRDETTLRRELKSLDAIRDHSPKYLLHLDDDPPADHDGIRQIFALDWLLGT